MTGTAAMGPPGVRVAGGMSYAVALGSGAASGIQRPSGNSPSGPQGVTAPGAGRRQDQVAFLMPVGSTDYAARDVTRILKANIDPVAKGIRDVTLRHIGGGTASRRPPRGSPAVPANEGEGGEADSLNQLWRGIMVLP
ncbi:hypothetical protein MRX96_044103 [Rhipicephalus microplus]